MTLGEDAYQILELAAKEKFITVQQLLRAVIIPEWVEENPPVQNIDTTPINRILASN